MLDGELQNATLLENYLATGLKVHILWPSNSISRTLTQENNQRSVQKPYAEMCITAMSLPAEILQTTYVSVNWGMDQLSVQPLESMLSTANQKASAQQKKRLTKWKSNLQNGRKYLQTKCLRRGQYPKYINNSYNSIAKKNMESNLKMGKGFT